jgi:hypothetical protein
LDLLAELEALRKQAHDRLQTAEYEFMQAERALGVAKRAKREKEIGK